ncbi:MAG: hypothetical protein OXG19_09370 [Chloroflexi bacterium]|nr:hypothetical protein [Chloroflexota bacterium]
MRNRGWLWSLVCVLTATVLACSDAGTPDTETVEQPAPQVSDQAQPEPAAAQSQMQQEEPAAVVEAGYGVDAGGPATAQADPQAPPQQNAYGGPPPRVADPREALAAGVPLLPSAPAMGDEYGWSAAIDGDIIAVGAPYHDAVAENAGAVFVFERQDGEWVETALLLPPYGEPLGWFGRWLALDDGRLVIGAPYEDVTLINSDDLIIDAGSAYVYESIDGVWRRTATLVPEPLLPGASFGWSVAIDGDRLAVAAWGDTVDGERVGAVYVYRESKGLWRLEARVVPPDPQPSHQFGRDIDLQENVLVVGAPGYDGEHSDIGAIYVYHQFGFAWNFAGKYIAPNGGAEDGLGTQVDLSLPRIAAGAHSHDQEGWNAGVLHLWRLYDTWEYDARLVASDGAVNDWFGYASAIDGNMMVVGSPGRADPETGLYRTGAAYVFELIDETWVERGVLGPVDPATAGEQAEFGWVIDLNAGEVVVGSWLADAAVGEDAGAAAVYTIGSNEP